MISIYTNHIQNKNRSRETEIFDAMPRHFLRSVAEAVRNSTAPRPLRKIAEQGAKITACAGFTLMETIIYIALFGLIMSGAVVTAYQLLEGGRRNKTSISVQEEGTFLTRKINWALVGASDVSVPATNTLIIIRPSLALRTPSESPLTITASGTVMTLSRGGAAPMPLNGDAFAVTNLEFSIEPSIGGRPTSTVARFLVNKKPFTLKTYLRR